MSKTTAAIRQMIDMIRTKLAIAVLITAHGTPVPRQIAPGYG